MTTPEPAPDRAGERNVETEDRSESEMSEEMHPLDLPAMAAFAANYGLSGEQAARRWGTAVKNVREHFRMVADAAITASGLGDALAEQAAHAASPDADGSGSAAEIMADSLLRDILEAICKRDGLSLESAVEPSRPARNYELADRLGIGGVFGLQSQSAATAEPQPAPELAAAMADPDDGYLTPIDVLEQERDEARGQLAATKLVLQETSRESSQRGEQLAAAVAAHEADIASITDQRNRCSDTADQLRALVDGITRTVRKWTVVPQDHAEINDWRKQAGLEAL